MLPSKLYEPVKTVPPRLTLLAATLVALTIELPDRFKLSPTGNSFILLSLTTSGILFAIFAPCFYIYPVGAVFLYGWLTGKLLVNPHL